MQKMLMGVMILWAISLPTQAYPDTTGTLAIGGQSSLGLSSPKFKDVQNSAPASSEEVGKGLLSFRYGLSSQLNITGFVGLEMVYLHTHVENQVSLTESKTSLDLGIQFDYILAQFENSRIAVGFALFAEGLGARSRRNSQDENAQNITESIELSVVPSLNYEYFVLPYLSLSASLSLPVTIPLGYTESSENRIGYLSAVTTFRPVAGIHYYF